MIWTKPWLHKFLGHVDIKSIYEEVQEDFVDKDTPIVEEQEDYMRKHSKTNDNGKYRLEQMIILNKKINISNLEPRKIFDQLIDLKKGKDSFYINRAW